MVWNPTLVKASYRMWVRKEETKHQRIISQFRSIEANQTCQLHMDLEGLIVLQCGHTSDVGSGWNYIVIWENNAGMIICT